MKEQVKPFYLQRNLDETGISGTGVVALGCQLPSGTCILEWTSYHTSLGIYRNINDLEALHGHSGNTVVVWGTPDNVAVQPNKPKSNKNDLSCLKLPSGLWQIYNKVTSEREKETFKTRKLAKLEIASRT